MSYCRQVRDISLKSLKSHEHQWHGVLSDIHCLIKFHSTHQMHTAASRHHPMSPAWKLMLQWLSVHCHHSLLLPCQCSLWTSVHPTPHASFWTSRPHITQFVAFIVCGCCVVDWGNAGYFSRIYYAQYNGQQTKYKYYTYNYFILYLYILFNVL